MRPICPVSGKVAYATEAEAVGPDDSVIGVYRCPLCLGWHRTRAKRWKQPVRQAEQPRARARKRKGFDGSPLAQKLPQATVEALRRIAFNDDDNEGRWNEMATTTIETEDEAVQVLLEDQQANGCILTFPASGAVEDKNGWSFYNVNGYLGTVTPKGEVVDLPEYADDE